MSEFKHTKSTAQVLTEKYGGKWKYDGTSSWNCDDGKRHVARTAGCLHDEYAPTQYWLYEEGETPIRVW